MWNTIKKFIKENSGFTLVEALVTIVILGAAIVPISMVFTRTIETTVTTRKQLEANEIAHSYLEYIKASPMDRIDELLTAGGSRTFTSNDDLSLVGLPNLQDGYQVTLSYDTAKVSELATIPGNQEIAQPESVDAVIEIASNKDDDVTINVTGAGISTIPSAVGNDISKVNRVIYIEVRRVFGESYGRVEITYRDENDQVQGFTGPSFNTNADGDIAGAVRFAMGNSDEGDAPNAYNTKIIVDSNMPNEFTVYIYEDENNTIKATTETASGIVRFSRNLKEYEPIVGRIVELTARVEDNITGEVLATMKSTKFDE